ncbi:MAG: putative Ig domain-containing protein [Pirellulaceae bacterium]
MNIRELWKRFSVRRRKRSRPQRRQCRFSIESLERRELLAGDLVDLAITDVQLINFLGDPVEQVFLGEQVFLKAKWEFNGLAKSDRYVVRFSIDGVELDSKTQTGGDGAGGSAGTAPSVRLDLGRRAGNKAFWNRGAWAASPGVHNVTVTLDPEGAVAETNESNNSLSFSFTPTAPSTLPGKLVWPVGGIQNVDWICCGYVDVGTSQPLDYRGGDFMARGHIGLDIGLVNFAKMDAGVPVFAAAAGTVTEAHDGNNDRGSDAGNGLFIAHGNGWKTYYAHMARDTITVKKGDLVTPGQLLGYVGASGVGRPHLDFGLQHNGGVVETLFAPDDYWQDSPAKYPTDIEAGFPDFGITNFSLDLGERPTPHAVYPKINDPSSFIAFWNYVSHKHAGDVITNKWLRPDGTAAISKQSTTGATDIGGFGVALMPRSNFNVIGTWYWVREVNGVEKLRAPFEITSGVGAAAIRVTLGQNKKLIIGGRTTPISFGSVAVSSSAPQRTFTIKNHGDAALTLSDLTMPPGFSGVGSFPASIDPGANVDFTLQLDTSRAGKKFGEIRFTTNDPDTALFNFNIEGDVEGVPPAGSPLVELPGPAVGYAFQQGPVVIDRAATVSGSTDFRGGSLVVEMAGGITPEDRLAVRNQGSQPNAIGVSGSTITFDGTVIATFSGGSGASPLVIDFNNRVSLDAAGELLRSITFANIAQTPSTRPRYIRFTLTNGVGLVSNQPIKKVVLADFEYNKAPNVTPITNQIAAEDAAFAFTPPTNTFSDDNTFDETLTLVASRSDGSSLPDWLSFDPQLQRFSGTPRNDDVGRLAVLVTATDLGGLTATDEFEIRVANTNDAPTVANSISNQQVLEDSLFDFAFAESTFVEVDAGDSLAYSAALPDGSPLPSWLNFATNQRKFSGTPSNDHVGTFTVRVTATDEASATANTDFEVTVVNINDPPSLSAPISDQSATQDAAFDFTFAVNTFSDVDADDSLRFSASLSDGSSLPTWLSFDRTARRFQGTPGNSDVGITAVRVMATDNAGRTVLDYEARTEVSLIVEVQDSGSPPRSSTTVITVEIDDVNEFSPMIKDQSFSIDENTLAAVSIGLVRAQDQDLSQTLRHSMLAGNTNNAFTLNSATGEITVNTDQLDHETTAQYQLLIEVTDDVVPTRSSRATVTIDVRDLNEFTPEVLDQSFAIDEDSSNGAVVGTVFASDADSSQSLAYALTAGNAGGAFAIDESTGELTAADTSQLDHETTPQRSLQVTVTDSGSPSRSSTGSILIGVLDANEAPQIDAQLVEQTMGANVLFEFQLPDNAFVDPDSGDSLRYTAQLADGSLLPSWLSFDASLLQFSGAASDADTGTLEIRVTASDRGAPSLTETQSFQLAITANPFPWQNTLKPRDVDRDGTIAPIDVLLVINELNSPKVSLSDRRLPLPYDPSAHPFDVNADGFVTPVDALIVINFLNQPVSMFSEAEAVLVLDKAQGSETLFDIDRRDTEAAATLHRFASAPQ